MAFKQREKKRKAKAKMESSRRAARVSGSAASKWWLTVVTRDTCCARCAGVLRIGRPLVYRAVPREALCQECAEGAGIRARPSVAWERARMKGRS